MWIDLEICEFKKQWNQNMNWKDMGLKNNKIAIEHWTWCMDGDNRSNNQENNWNDR
jgi:hypothetical protein